MQSYSPDNAPGEETEYEGYDLDKLKGFWREWVEGYGDARKQSFIDQAYYDGDVKGTGEGHYTELELEKLRGRNQPPVVFNLIKRKVNAIAGVEQRSRAEPRALPRTPKDQKAAEIATDALRFVKERTRSGTVSALAFMDALIAGYAGSEIGGAEDHVPETHLPWRDIAFDPLSRRQDFSDARWLAVAKWLDVDTALETYVPPEPPQPEPLPPPQIPPQPLDPALAPQWAAQAQQVIAMYEMAVQQQQAQYQAALEKRQAIIDRITDTAGGTGSGALSELNYDDHPAATFCDAKRRRIFVVDMWHRDPKHGWFRCVFTGAGKLFTQPAYLVEKDPLTNRQVKVPGLRFFSLYVSKDGWRYGEVRGMRSPQDEVNKRRSKALHLLTVNQVFYSPRAGLAEADKEKLRAEIARPDGAIEAMDITQIRVDRNVELAQGQQQLGAEARAFMEMEGPNPQLQGEQGRATSGRAVLALQQAGLGQLGPIFDRKHEWDDARFRSYWFRIQQFWTAPMYVRVTDDKNAAKFAAVNGARVVHADNGNQQGPQGGQPQPMMPPQAGPEPGAMLGHNNGPPMTPEDMGETGPMLAELDMDIIIDRAPEAATLQAEQFEELAKLGGTGLFNSLPPLEVARLMIAASSLPNKSELLDMIDQMKAKPQQPDPMQMATLKELVEKVNLIVAQRNKTQAETTKIAAEIPGTHAESAQAQAEARSAHVNATMNKIGASRALNFDALMPTGGSPATDPMAAASPPGVSGLPPIQG